MCEYKFRNGERCKEEALPNSKYCILHIDLPKESEEFKGINELKEEKVKEKISKGDFNFEGAKLFEVKFSGVKFGPLEIIVKDSVVKLRNEVNFCDAVIIADASFSWAEIDGDAWFDRTEIGGNAWFEGAKIGGDAWFEGAKIGGFAMFGGAEIGGGTLFSEAKIGRNASFTGAKIGGFDVWFDPTEIKGELFFENTKFRFPEAQERACRKARRVCENLGNRAEADYYFYREMEAKRKQKYKTFSLKPILKLTRKLELEKLISKHIGFLEKKRSIYWGFLELPVQYIFGYGVYPWRVITTWLLTVFSLAFVYWLGNGIIMEENLLWWERILPSIYFSIVTAATPGYGGYKPASGLYQGLASVEAIFGTFMWAAFIATFARKYMR